MELLESERKEKKHFNQTIVELKFLYPFLALTPPRILIRPLWNWNYSETDLGGWVSYFNQTIVELK